MRVFYSEAPVRPPVGIIFGTVAATVMLAFAPGEWLLFALLIAYGVLWSSFTGNDITHPVEFDKLYLMFFFMYCVMPFCPFFPGRFYWPLDTVTMWVMVIMIVGIVVGGKIASSSNFKQRFDFDLPWNLERARRAGWAYVGIGAAMLAILVAKVGLSTYVNGSYVSIYAAEDGLGYLVAGTFLFQIGTITLALAYWSDRKFSWVPMIPFAALVLSNLRIGRRGIGLSTLLGVLIVYHYCYRPLRYKWLVAGVGCLIVLYSIVGFARSYKDRSWDEMVAITQDEFTADDVWSGLGEFGSTPLSIYETMQLVPQQSPYRLGMSYLEALEAVIPQKIHPNRPMTSSQWFVWFYDPTTAAHGGGYAYSVIAEGYLNFGFLGILFVGIITGYLVRRMVMFRSAAPASRSRLLIYAALSTQVPYMIRGDAGSVMKNIIVCTYLPALLLIMYLAPKTRPAAGKFQRAAAAPGGHPIARISKPY